MTLTKEDKDWVRGQIERHRAAFIHTPLMSQPPVPPPFTNVQPNSEGFYDLKTGSGYFIANELIEGKRRGLNIENGQTVTDSLITNFNALKCKEYAAYFGGGFTGIINDSLFESVGDANSYACRGALKESTVTHTTFDNHQATRRCMWLYYSSGNTFEDGKSIGGMCAFGARPKVIENGQVKDSGDGQGGVITDGVWTQAPPPSVNQTFRRWTFTHNSGNEIHGIAIWPGAADLVYDDCDFNGSDDKYIGIDDRQTGKVTLKNCRRNGVKITSKDGIKGKTSEVTIEP